MKIYSLSLRNLKEIYRDPVSMILGLGLPVGLLLLFTSINKKVPLETFSAQSLTPGIIIFCFAFLIMFSAILLARDRQTAFLTRLFTTPLKSSDFIISYTLPFLPLSIFQIIICMIVGFILGASFQHILLAGIILIITALICVSTGMILGTLFTVNQVSGVGSMMITAIALFSGAWMDLEMVGGLFKKIGYALPFAHAVDAAKGLLKGSSFSDVASGFYILLAYAVTLFFLAIIAFRWRIRRG